MPDHPIKPKMRVHLQRDGLLWLINTTVFHPRGFALAIDEDKGKLYLMGDGLERWSYSEDPVTKQRLDECFVLVEDTFRRAAEHNRGADGNGVG